MKSFYSKRVIKILLYDKQKGKCNQCREPFAIRGLEVDHIIPRAGGGSDVPSNFQLLCKPCNYRKHATIARGAQYTLFDEPREPKRLPAKAREHAVRAMTPAERKRRQRAEAKAAGKCITCCRRKATRGLKCDDCADKAIAAVYASRGKMAPKPKKAPPKPKKRNT